MRPSTDRMLRQERQQDSCVRSGSYVSCMNGMDTSKTSKRDCTAQLRNTCRNMQKRPFRDGSTRFDMQSNKAWHRPSRQFEPPPGHSNVILTQSYALLAHAIKGTSWLSTTVRNPAAFANEFVIIVLALHSLSNVSGTFHFSTSTCSSRLAAVHSVFQILPAGQHFPDWQG